jgi:two-component sensor histidine kinase
MWQWLRAFFDDKTLSPHGICLLWRPELIWTHAVSDLLIGMAYFSIPLVLGVFLYHRRDVRFGWAVWMFVLFIMLCGLTHFMMIWTLWSPQYGLEALIKIATATASLTTAVALWPLLPKAIALPSTATLQARIAERDQAVAELKAAMATMVRMEEVQKQQAEMLEVRNLLMREVDHRARNALAVVQSVVRLSQADNPETFKQVVIGRVDALARAQASLSRSKWEGGQLASVVSEELAAAAAYSQWRVEGPAIELPHDHVQPLGMILHELTTNAVKYGALSVAGGQVQVAWERIGPCGWRLFWTESGGPPVVPPTRTGFGSQLMRRLAKGMEAEIEFVWEPGGLKAVLTAAP